MKLIHNGVTIHVTNIINGNTKTGTKFTFEVGGHKRQAFTEDAAKKLIEDLQSALAALPKSAPAATTTISHERNREALANKGDLKSPEVFG